MLLDTTQLSTFKWDYEFYEEDLAVSSGSKSTCPCREFCIYSRDPKLKCSHCLCEMHKECFDRLLEAFAERDNIICPSCMKPFDNSRPLIAIPGSKSGLFKDDIVDSDLDESNIVLTDIPKAKNRQQYFDKFWEETNDLKCCKSVMKRKVVGALVRMFLEHIAAEKKYSSVEDIKSYIVSKICDNSNNSNAANQLIEARRNSQLRNIWKEESEDLSCDVLKKHLDYIKKLPCKKWISKFISDHVGTYFERLANPIVMSLIAMDSIEISQPDDKITEKDADRFLYKFDIESSKLHLASKLHLINMKASNELIGKLESLKISLNDSTDDSTDHDGTANICIRVCNEIISGVSYRLLRLLSSEGTKKMIKERLIELYKSLAETILGSLISDDPTKRKLIQSVDNRSRKKHKLNAEVVSDKEAKGRKRGSSKGRGGEESRG